MKYKIGSAFFCIIFSSIALCAQSIVVDQTIRLQAELDDMKSINQELRREYDSLKNLNISNLPSGYYVRLNGRFVGNNSATYRIIRDQMGGKEVYSIASFSSATEAYHMASGLRELNLRDVEVVKVDEAYPAPSQQSSRSKISQTMIIEN